MKGKRRSQDDERGRSEVFIAATLRRREAEKRRLTRSSSRLTARSISQVSY